MNGFEIENSSEVHAYENEAFGNTAGLLVALVPGLPVKAASDVIVERNRLHDNNLPNFASGGFEALVPQGSGLLIIGVDGVTARDNEVTGNEFVGIGLAGSTIIPLLGGGPVDDIEPFPDGTRIVENRVTGNGGAQPIPILPPGVDLLWDGTGRDNCWAGNAFDTSLNLDLPGGSPTPLLPACA